MEYKYTKDNKRVAVVGQLNSAQSIIQDVYYLNGDETKPTLGGEPYTYTTANLFDEPVKPAEWKWLQDDIKKLNDERRKNQEEINRERETFRCKMNRLRSLSKWLDNVSKEPQEERVKEIVKLMSILYSTSKKWLVTELNYLPKVIELETIADDSVYKFFTNSYNSEKACFLGLYSDAQCVNVHVAVTEFSDGSGDRTRFLIFDNEETLHKYLQGQIDKKDEYSFAVIDYAKEHSLVLDKEKVKQMLHKSLERSKKEYDRCSKELNQYKDSIDKQEKELKNYE
jgi:hypothetical protein